ncbi:MAG: type II secretion system protein GspG [bacterium]
MAGSSCTVQRHRSRVAPLLFTVLALCVFVSVAQADVIVFTDGRRFHCRILEMPEDRTDDGYRVESQGNILWIHSSYVQSYQRDTVDLEGDDEAVRALLEQLIQEGRIVPTLSQQLELIPKPVAPPSAELALRVTDVRGWGYLVQNSAAGQGGRSAIASGDAVPPGYTVEVSPNSRLTMALGPAAKLGLDTGTRLSVISVGFEPDTFVYRLQVDLSAGTLWLDVLSLGELRKVKLIVNGTQVFLNKRLMVCRAPSDGGIEVAPLSETVSLTNAAGGRVPKVAPGERWVSKPGSAEGEILSDPNWDRDLRIWNEWETWQPESLEMDWRPVLPSLQPHLVFETAAPLFPWPIPVGSSLILPPEQRSMAETISAYLAGIRAYRKDIGSYPPQTDWTKLLSEDPNIQGWNGPYVKADVSRLDLWGRPFVYEVFRDGDSTFVDVRSRGLNGEDDRGLGDDIRFGYKE